MKSILFILTIAIFASASKAQETSTIFEKISKAAKEYKLDTSAVPNDKITAQIKQLRSLKGGFNINEAIEYKIEEDLQKNETSKEDIMKLSASFKTGLGRKWLDNAVIRIYREHFSYSELKQLVKFYKTSAGQKMATEFPVIMIKSFAAAETIQKILAKK